MQTDLFATEEPAADTLSGQPAAAAGKRRARAKKESQLDLFYDDPMGAMALLDVAEQAALAVDKALDSDPALLGLGPEASPAQVQRAREALELARFLRATGASVDDVQKQVSDALEVDGEQSVRLLLEIERKGGPLSATPAAAATKSRTKDRIEEIADDFVGADVADEDDDIDPDHAVVELGEDLDGDADEEEKPAKRAAKGEAVADNALGGLMRSLRAEKHQPLTAEQERALGQRIKQGDPAARTELIERNMRYLISFARRFIKTGRDLSFIVSAGTVGLVRAADKFNPDLGFRFSTYATWWIRQSIQREINRDTVFGVPSYLPHQENKLRKAAEAEEDEVRKAELLEQATSARHRLAARSAAAVSLDMQVGDDDGDTTMVSLLSAEGSGLDEQMEKRQLLSQLIKFSNEIEDDRMRDIFMGRLGLHEDHLGEPLSLADVAEWFDISRERARQLHALAAQEVNTKMMVWAKGEHNLPDGFRKSIASPGR